MSVWTCRGVRCAYVPSSSAMAPVTCAVAIDVPDCVARRLSGHVDKMCAPGAYTSMDGWTLLNGAIDPSVLSAPTPIVSW